MYALIKNEEVTKMHEIINKIVQQNQSLFGTNPKIDKINIGFTNTIYNINDLYIVKICTDEDNEKEFKKEIDFLRVSCLFFARSAAWKQSYSF